MSTRFYLPGMISTWMGTPIAGSAVWTGYNATWFSVSDLRIDKTQLEAQNSFGQAGVVGEITPIQQLISDPLLAQTIAGTVKGVIRAYEDADSMAQGVVVIRLVSNDGQTVRGTLLEYIPSSLTSEFIVVGTTARNAFFPPPATSLTSQDAQDGDRLVIEIGFKPFSESGDPGASVKLCIQDNGDLEENETGQDSTLDPWIEFSQALAFQPTPYDVVAEGGVQMGGIGTMVAVGVFRPLTLDVVASGWLAVDGGDTYEVVYPTDWIESTDGLHIQVGGTGVVGMAYPPVTVIPGVIGVGISGGSQYAFFRPIAVQASGGVEVGGQGIVAFEHSFAGDFVATGGIKVGSLDLPLVTCTRPDNALLAIVATGVLFLGGGGIREEVFYPEITDIVPTPIRVRIGGDGGASVYYPPVMAIVSVGLPLVLGGGDIEESAFETWVITGVEHRASIYSGFQFNSYAEFRGLHYGCADDGLYLMNQEGKGDDNGRSIHPGIRIGPTNFQAGAKKFVRSIHPGQSGSNTRVLVSTDTEESYPIPHAGQFVGKREHVSDEFIIDISDFDKLGRVEIVPMVLPRR